MSKKKQPAEKGKKVQKKQNKREYPLNERQIAFANCYAECKVATKAAIDAGYAKSGAHVVGNRLLRNDKVVALINQKLAKSAKRAGESIERIAKDFREILDHAKQLNPKNGKMKDYHAAINAADKLAKHLGFYQKDNSQKSINTALDAMATDELRNLINSGG